MPRKELKENDLSILYSKSPIDKTAAKVTSKGPDYSLSNYKPENEVDSVLPYPCLSCPIGVHDLKGEKWGRIQVIGFHSTRRSGRAKKVVSEKWVVKCACGMYSIRTSQAIKRKSNPDECCGRCNYLKIIRKRQSGVYDK